MDNIRVKNFFNNNEALLVTGSLNCNPQDRYLNREDIHPVQVYMDGVLRPIKFFDSWGDFGASSLTFIDENGRKFLFSTGDQTFIFDMQQGTWQSLAWLDLKDVHEIELIDNSLWLSNTGYDEALEIKAWTGKIKKHLKLHMFKEKNQVDNISPLDNELEKVDCFHCNQITEDYQGNLIALVHHTSGQQIIRRVANKLIKNQGNGGIINLSNGESINLKLKSPHSIRKVDGNYWIFDSGNSRIHIYDKDWLLKHKIESSGFGRGAAVSGSGVFCAGISETRKRYLNIIEGAKKVPNMVQFFSAKNHKLLDEMIIRDVEQINNVYIFNKNQINSLLKFDSNMSDSFSAFNAEELPALN